MWFVGPDGYYPLWGSDVYFACMSQRENKCSNTVASKTTQKKEKNKIKIKSIPYHINNIKIDKQKPMERI